MSESLAMSVSAGSHESPVVTQEHFQPSIVSVGVVLYEWNEAVRQRVHRLGAQLGNSGLKIQLLTHSDIVRKEDKSRGLDGLIFQLPADAASPLAKRFEMIFRHCQQELLTECDVAAAFSVTEEGAFSNIELAMQVSFAAHGADCQWLGLEYSTAESATFQSWCEGIAVSVRQSASKLATLAA